jgi:hypothetical protein
VAHTRALADGGTNELDNIKPMPHDEHVADHKAEGDFSRWSRTRSTGGSLRGSSGSPPSNPGARPPSPSAGAASSKPQLKPGAGSIRPPGEIVEPATEEAAAAEELSEDEAMEDTVIEAFIPE